MEETVNTGVNESVAAEQTEVTQETELTTEETQQTQEETGVETKSAAETNENVEKAFAARLKEATAKAKQEARDEYIASQGYVWNGKPITTEAEYTQALKEKAYYDSLQDKDLPEEVVNELVESRAFREQWAEQQKRQEDYAAFVKAYPDVKADDIPEQVLLEAHNGRPLVEAYRAHENQQLRAKIAELEDKLQIREKNTENAQTSTGSVTGQGTVQTTFYTREQVDAMSQTEVNKNYPAILESMKQWK